MRAGDATAVFDLFDMTPEKLRAALLSAQPVAQPVAQTVHGVANLTIGNDVNSDDEGVIG